MKRSVRLTSVPGNYADLVEIILSGLQPYNFFFRYYANIADFETAETMLILLK